MVSTPPNTQTLDPRAGVDNTYNPNVSIELRARVYVKSRRKRLRHLLNPRIALDLAGLFVWKIICSRLRSHLSSLPALLSAFEKQEGPQ